MSDLRDAARQALEALETVFMPHHPAVIALKAALAEHDKADAINRLEDDFKHNIRQTQDRIRAALAEEALQRLTDVHQEIEAVLEQPKFTLSCGCPSQYGGVPAYWEKDGSTAFGMICEKHWHEYGARSEA